MAKKNAITSAPKAAEKNETKNSTKATSLDSVECNIERFCDLHGGIHNLDKIAVIRKYRGEKKLFSEWKAILIEATVIKQ